MSPTSTATATAAMAISSFSLSEDTSKRLTNGVKVKRARVGSTANASTNANANAGSGTGGGNGNGIGIGIGIGNGFRIDSGAAAARSQNATYKLQDDFFAVFTSVYSFVVKIFEDHPHAEAVQRVTHMFQARSTGWQLAKLVHKDCPNDHEEAVRVACVVRIAATELGIARVC